MSDPAAGQYRHRLGSIASHLENGSIGPVEEASIRKSLLQRVVDRAEIVRAVSVREVILPNDCCSVPYVDRDGHSWMIFICDYDCTHWHHDQEVWMA